MVEASSHLHLPCGASVENLRKRLKRRPKRERVLGYPVPAWVISTPDELRRRRRHAKRSAYLKSQTNEPSERSNPPMALQRKLEKETIRTPALGRRYKCAPTGRMAQEANAWGNAQDMLISCPLGTWAGCSGRQRASKCQGFPEGHTCTCVPVQVSGRCRHTACP